MRGAEVTQLTEPEGRDAVEHLALARHAIVHDHVKRAQTVRHHDQNLVAQIVNVTHLALNLIHARNVHFHQRTALVKFHALLLK